LFSAKPDCFQKGFRTAVRFPKTESNRNACRFDKLLAFSGTPSMNDTGCQNEQGALGHVMIECLKRIIHEYQYLEPPSALLPRRVAIGSLPGKVSVVTGVRGSGKTTLASIIGQHNISHPRAVIDLAHWLVDNTGFFYAVSHLTDHLKSLGHRVRKSSVVDWLVAFERCRVAV